MSKEEYTAYWKCRVCGAKSPESAKVCRQCGAGLLLHADLVSSDPTPPPPPPEPPIEWEEEEKKGIKGWMIGLAAVLAIALLGALALPRLGDFGNDSQFREPDIPATTQTQPVDTAPVATAPPATEPPETEAPTEPCAEATEEATEEVTEATEESTVMTYAEYLATPMDYAVCIETYVQARKSWWDNKIKVYCQDEEGAYFLYDLACSEEDAAKLVPGTKIRVNGYKHEWAGEVEIEHGTFEFIEADSLYIGANDYTELLGTDELINHQNELAAFFGMTVEAIEYKDGEPGDDIYVTLGYNGASYDFSVEVYLTGPESEVYTTVGELEVGDVVNVEGYLYWYEGVNPHITSITVAE